LGGGDGVEGMWLGEMAVARRVEVSVVRGGGDGEERRK
jgi:hypothetical protein